MELPPGAGERLLGGILGVASIPQHRQREAQTGLDQRPDQQLERHFVAGDRSETKRLVSRQAHSVCHTL